MKTTDGPNFPAMIHRSSDDIAEINAIRLTPAEAAAGAIIHRLDDKTRDQLGAWLDRETGVYAAEEVRELHKQVS